MESDYTPVQVQVLVVKVIWEVSMDVLLLFLGHVGIQLKATPMH